MKIERVLIGLPISPGIAIGPAFVSDDGMIAVPEYRIAASDLEAER
jgi:phosphotransferase system enzyme I (PtsI)